MLLLTLYFFLIIAAFWIQRPLRTSKFVKAAAPARAPQPASSAEEY